MTKDRNNNPLDGQVSNLAAQLGQEGTEPGRDLWPGIESRIDQIERAHPAEQTPARGGRRGSWTLSLWRVGSLAAVLALVVGLGYLGTMEQAVPGQDQAAGRQVGNDSMLRDLGSTLQDLNAALAADPENHQLGRLVLLVHKSRTQVLRGSTRELEIGKL
jgi:hypothetical protein